MDCSSQASNIPRSEKKTRHHRGNLRMALGFIRERQHFSQNQIHRREKSLQMGAFNHCSGRVPLDSFNSPVCHPVHCYDCFVRAHVFSDKKLAFDFFTSGVSPEKSHCCCPACLLSVDNWLASGSHHIYVVEI